MGITIYLIGGSVLFVFYLLFNFLCCIQEDDDAEFDAELGMTTRIRHERGI